MIDRLAAVAERDVSRETFEVLSAYVAMLVAESAHQSLVSKASLADIWERHIVDSAQLVPMALLGPWVDIGSGAGLPGVVVAILTGEQVTLVEPRRLRVAFLQRIKAHLALENLTIYEGRSGSSCGIYPNITARAVASASSLFAMTLHLSSNDTVWLLPRGRSAQKELDEVRASWQGAFRLEPSRTDPVSSILIASGVQARGKR